MTPTPRKPLLTTSWDDGHVLDFRIAELLTQYGLTGTFYIPRSAPTGTMSEDHVRELSAIFEIGAHTLDHLFLTEINLPRAAVQIVGSKQWVEQTTGEPCTIFCPPAGKLTRQHLGIIKASGFSAVRSVEYMSLDHPRDGDVEGLSLIPTTIQAKPTPGSAYLRNVAKRFALRNLWLYLLHARSPIWSDNVRRLLELTIARNGVFHLWGHSWEIEEHHQWDRLEQVFQLMSEFRAQAPCVTNSALLSDSPRTRRDPAESGKGKGWGEGSAAKRSPIRTRLSPS
jgi:peptidoglycan/xylan/chitin deacetylase (PgdA/CDA1 family)